MDLNFELLRGERRSFFCNNKLWFEIKKKAKGMSISQYIRNAILEKMISEDPKNKEYYETLLSK